MGYPNSLYVSQHDMDDPSKDSSGKRSPPGSTKTTPVKQLVPPKRSRHSSKEDEATLACINMCHSMIIDRCMHILSFAECFCIFLVMHHHASIFEHTNAWTWRVFKDDCKRISNAKIGSKVPCINYCQHISGMHVPGHKYDLPHMAFWLTVQIWQNYLSSYTKQRKINHQEVHLPSHCHAGDQGPSKPGLCCSTWWQAWRHWWLW